MRSLCIFTVAVVLVGISPLLAGDTASLQTMARPGSVPTTENLMFSATGITASFQDPAGIVPCWNCVAGAGTANIGIAAPIAAIESGSALNILMTGDDMNYYGQARFEYSLTSGGTTVMADSVSGPAYPGIWLAVFPVTAPAPGRYLLQGAIRSGQTLATSSVVTGQLIIF